MLMFLISVLGMYFHKISCFSTEYKGKAVPVDYIFMHESQLSIFDKVVTFAVTRWIALRTAASQPGLASSFFGPKAPPKVRKRR